MGLTMVTLRNGASVPKSLVAGIYVILQGYWNGGLVPQLAIYELAMRARDPNFEISPDGLRFLTDHHLLEEDGSLQTAVKNIVLSSVLGEEADMYLDSPVPDQPQGGS